MTGTWHEWAWADGAMVALGSLKIPVTSDFALRGLSVFEGMRGYQLHRPAGEEAVHLVAFGRHRERLASSAASLHVPLSQSGLAEVFDGAVQLVRKVGSGNIYLRPTVGLERGAYTAHVDLDDVRRFVLARPTPEAEHSRAVRRAIVSRWAHVSPDQFPTDAKVGAQYAQYHLSRIEAEAAGASEAILLNARGNVAETGGASVLIVRDQRIYTPAITDGILPSITREIVIGLARSLGLDVVEASISRNELFSGGSVLLAGTLDELSGVHLEGAAVAKDSDREVSSTLISTYRQFCYEPTSAQIHEYESLIIHPEGPASAESTLGDLCRNSGENS